MTLMQYGRQSYQDDRKNVDKKSAQYLTNSPLNSNMPCRLFSSKGAILIEFAVAIPILIALLCYIHDLSKYALMKERMEFVAHLMVNMLQNISQRRQNKRITATDIKYAISATYLAVYRGTTMWPMALHCLPLGHAPFVVICCVKGLANEKASVMWYKSYYSVDHYPCTPASMGDGDSPNTNATNVDQSIIYPGLKIKEGEIKIIVDCSILVSYSQYSLRETLGFLILNPTYSGRNVVFNTVVIFTPSPGLFNETHPTEALLPLI